MQEPQEDVIYDNAESNSTFQELNNEVENEYSEYSQKERLPDYPSELKESQNQLRGAQVTYDRHINERPLKKKKSKKGKNGKMNTSMTNRSSSAKWRKVDPYLRGAPNGIKMLKHSRRVTRDDEPNTMLPPINKQSTSQVNKVNQNKTYKPLHPIKLQKTQSSGASELGSHKNLQLDEDSEKVKNKKQPNKISDIDYEKKNLERLQKLKEKKAQEMAMMEEQRQKAHEEREKLRQIVRKSQFLHFIPLIYVYSHITIRCVFA